MQEDNLVLGICKCKKEAFCLSSSLEMFRIIKKDSFIIAFRIIASNILQRRLEMG
jgi:hypothetical protein